MYKPFYHPNTYALVYNLHTKLIRILFSMRQCNKLLHLKSARYSLCKCQSTWEMRNGRCFRSSHCSGTVIATEISYRGAIIRISCWPFFWHHKVPFSLAVLKKLENAAPSSDCFEIYIPANESRGQISKKGFVTECRLYDIEAILFSHSVDIISARH